MPLIRRQSARARPSCWSASAKSCARRDAHHDRDSVWQDEAQSTTRRSQRASPQVIKAGQERHRPTSPTRSSTSTASSAGETKIKSVVLTSPTSKVEKVGTKKPPPAIKTAPDAAPIRDQPARRCWPAAGDRTRSTAASARCGARRVPGGLLPATRAAARTASRRHYRVRRWPSTDRTGAPTPRPRSSGAWPTSRVATAPRAAPGTPGTPTAAGTKPGAICRDVPRSCRDVPDFAVIKQVALVVFGIRNLLITALQTRLVPSPSRFVLGLNQCGGAHAGVHAEATSDSVLS